MVQESDRTKTDEEDFLREKFIATLVGCAIGDSLGMSVEGWKRKQIQKYIY